MNKKVSSKKRLAIFFIVVGLLLFIILTKAVGLVINNGDVYHHKALAQATSSGKTIYAQPGNILDRNGTTLAVTKRVYRLILDPKVLDETEETYPGSREKTIEILAEAFHLDKTELLQAFTEDTGKSYVRFGGSTILSEEEIETYNSLVEAFNKEKKEHNAATEVKSMKITAKVTGVWFEEEYRREYPLGSVLSKVIGYTTKDALSGILGLELSYDDVLRGTDGKQYTYIDEKGNVTTEVVEAQDGYTIVTSLDSYVAEKVKACIDQFNEETGGERIAVLVMDITNGEILAMESDTEFDLNSPTDLSKLFTEEELENPAETFLLQEAFKGRLDDLYAMSHEEQLEALLQQVQINFCISGTYEPGSTSKTLTLAGLYEEGLVDNSDTFWCDGAIGVENYTIHCHFDTLCGWLNPYEALGRSCNVCFVQMGRLLGPDNMQKYQEMFNLGQKTNIDLPGEANTQGLLYYGDDMGEIELATTSFGQSYNVTMIQFASAYASILNGGYYYQPHIVTEIRDLDGNTVKAVEPTLVRRTISEETSEYLKGALHFVVTNGTALLSATEGYPLGGKTGAAEKLPRGTGKYVISFISSCPIDNPRYLIYCVVDEPHVEDQSSSYQAQVLSRMCWESLYTYLGIYPETDADVYTYDWSQLQDFSGMNDSQGGQSFIEENEAAANE